MNMFKKNGGFTLVELIIVIAILAILAGIAVPAYTGYLDRANKAADDSLIDVMNTALASTCALHGVTTSDITVTISGTAITKVQLNDGQDGAAGTDVTSDYNTFYTGNTLVLKYYKSIEFNTTSKSVVGKTS